MAISGLTSLRGILAAAVAGITALSAQVPPRKTRTSPPRLSLSLVVPSRSVPLSLTLAKFSQRFSLPEVQFLQRPHGHMKLVAT